MTSGKEVAKVATAGTAIVPLVPTAQQVAMLRDSLGPGERISLSLLDRIKLPPGGGEYFTMQNGPPAKTVEGVLLLRQPTRAMWYKRYGETGGGTPPDCYSLDAVTGIGKPGGTCGEPNEPGCCPLNEWDTAENDAGEKTVGKKCREVTRIYMLFPGDVFPALLPLSPTSFFAAKQYAFSQIKNGGYWNVITSIALMPYKSTLGVDYSRAVFSFVRTLTDEEQAALAPYRSFVQPLLQAVEVSALTTA